MAGINDIYSQKRDDLVFILGGFDMLYSLEENVRNLYEIIGGLSDKLKTTSFPEVEHVFNQYNELLMNDFASIMNIVEDSDERNEISQQITSSKLINKIFINSLTSYLKNISDSFGNGTIDEELLENQVEVLKMNLGLVETRNNLVDEGLDYLLKIVKPEYLPHETLDSKKVINLASKLLFYNSFIINTQEDVMEILDEISFIEKIVSKNGIEKKLFEDLMQSDYVNFLKAATKSIKLYAEKENKALTIDEEKGLKKFLDYFNE